MFIGFGLGVLAAIFWSLTNVADKYLVTRYSQDGNVGGILLLSCFFPVLLVIVSFCYGGVSVFTTSLPQTLALLLSGGLLVLWTYFYLKALSVDDTSVVMTLLVLAPLFSLIFGALILNEWLTQFQLISAALIVLGALSVSYEPAAGRFNRTLILYAIGASLSLALLHSLFKLVTVPDDFWHSMFWRSMGMLLTGTILYLFVGRLRTNFHTFVQHHLSAGLGLNSLNETFTLVGDTIFAVAILFAPLALVQTTEAYQPIFVILITLALGRLGVTSLQENFARGRALTKLAGMVLVLSGSVLLAL